MSTFASDHPIEELRGVLVRCPRDVRRVLNRRLQWLRTKIAAARGADRPFDFYVEELAALFQALEAFTEAHPPVPPAQPATRAP